MVSKRWIQFALIFLLITAGFTLLDWDDDELQTYEEIGYSATHADMLDPFDADTSGDGIQDGDADAYGLDPATAYSNDFAAVFYALEGENRQELVDTVYANGTVDDAYAERLSTLATVTRADGPLDPRIAHLALENPHNVYPQMQQYVDGNISETVTDEDIANLSDPDGDGLLTWKERTIGTNASNPDTDGDGLPDGPEWAGGMVIDGTYHPLNESDPLHKDLYLREYPTDGEIPERERNELIDRFGDAPVTNPDSEDGITVHWEQGDGSRLEGLTVTERSPSTVTEGIDPLEETRYIAALKSFPHEPTDNSSSGGIAARGGAGYILINAQAPGATKGRAAGLMEHELLHNLLSKLDEEKQKPDDSSHPRQKYSPFKITNPDMTEEINRDGTLGLEIGEDFDTWSSSHDWRVAYSRSSP